MAAVQTTLSVRGGVGRGQDAAGTGGLAYADIYPRRLTGARQQRGAIARALAINPAMTRFDKPTSALAPEVVSEALDVMVALAREGITMMAVLYEMGFARIVMRCVVFMDAGEVVEDAAQEASFEDAASARSLLSDMLTHQEAPSSPVLQKSTVLDKPLLPQPLGLAWLLGTHR